MFYDVVIQYNSKLRPKYNLCCILYITCICKYIRYYAFLLNLYFALNKCLIIIFCIGVSDPEGSPYNVTIRNISSRSVEIGYKLPLRINGPLHTINIRY